MATLTTEKARIFSLSVKDAPSKMLMTASKIYRGSALGLSSQYVRVLNAGDVFVGFATETVDNSAGSSGDKSIGVKTRGEVQLTVTTISASSVMGITIYASDDDTFVTASTSNSTIGKLSRHISGTTGMVYFEGAAVRSI